MKVFGAHNTIGRGNSIQHCVPKMTLDHNNGCLCLSKSLMALMGIHGKQEAFVLFIEDHDGNFGITITKDKERGLPVWWYKRDTRARVYNSTVVDYLVEKFKIDRSANSYHIVFNQTPLRAGTHIFFKVKEVHPYHRSNNYTAFQ